MPLSRTLLFTLLWRPQRSSARNFTSLFSALIVYAVCVGETIHQLEHCSSERLVHILLFIIFMTKTSPKAKHSYSELLLGRHQITRQHDRVLISAEFVFISVMNAKCGSTLFVLQSTTFGSQYVFVY